MTSFTVRQASGYVRGWRGSHPQEKAVVTGGTGQATRRKVIKARAGPGRGRGMTAVAGGIGGDMIGRLTGARGLAAGLMAKYALGRCAFEYAIDMASLAGGELMSAEQRETADRVIEVRRGILIGPGGLARQQE